MRFRPEQHLRRQSDIQAVRDAGRRIDCRAFTVWWRTRAPAAPGEAVRPAVAPDLPRVCVIASTAAVGPAVQRNRAKRRLREVFRQQQNSVPPTCDLLLVARRTATTWDMPELQKRFDEACRLIQRGSPAPAPHS